ncbi:hypothetical protein G9A89_017993 [Geosiphon pyriformis]|nr:hypothetical protein G9A89_017993 [Geosiphon pyriformis]
MECVVGKLDNNIQVNKVLYWTDENFNTFKESIERLLPLIRFFNISSIDFYYKVKLFARILTKTLYKDLLHHYLVPGSHQICDNKGATVSVIKVKGTGQLISDYNPQSWHSGYDWLEGNGSFIFSLGDGKAGNGKLSKFFSAYGPYGETKFWALFWTKVVQGAIVKRHQIMSM